MKRIESRELRSHSVALSSHDLDELVSVVRSTSETGDVELQDAIAEYESLDEWRQRRRWNSKFLLIRGGFMFSIRLCVSHLPHNLHHVEASYSQDQDQAAFQEVTKILKQSTRSPMVWACKVLGGAALLLLSTTSNHVIGWSLAMSLIRIPLVLFFMAVVLVPTSLVPCLLDSKLGLESEGWLSRNRDALFVGIIVAVTAAILGLVLK